MSLSNVWQDLLFLNPEKYWKLVRIRCWQVGIPSATKQIDKSGRIRHPIALMSRETVLSRNLSNDQACHILVCEQPGVGNSYRLLSPTSLGILQPLQSLAATDNNYKYIHNRFYCNRYFFNPNGRDNWWNRSHKHMSGLTSHWSQVMSGCVLFTTFSWESLVAGLKGVCCIFYDLAIEFELSLK